MKVKTRSAIRHRIQQRIRKRIRGTQERPRVNLVWMRFPIEPTRSYEAMIECWLKAKVDGALVTHQGRDIGLQSWDHEALGNAIMFGAN